MNKKCAVCGNETKELSKGRAGLDVSRLCGEKCRNIWCRKNKEMKAHNVDNVDFSSLYPNISMFDVGDLNG